jgi:uncharacterized membrane protein YqjE
MITAEQAELRDRSTADLVKELSHQASVLVRKEIDLAKLELAEKGRQAGVGMAALVGAAIVGLAALGALTAFLILALDEAMPGWVAALIVTVLWAAVGVVLGLFGRAKLREMGSPVPEKTVDTLKEDLEWLKHPTS